MALSLPFQLVLISRNNNRKTPKFRVKILTEQFRLHAAHRLQNKQRCMSQDCSVKIFMQNLPQQQEYNFCQKIFRKKLIESSFFFQIFAQMRSGVCAGQTRVPLIFRKPQTMHVELVPIAHRLKQEGVVLAPILFFRTVLMLPIAISRKMDRLKQPVTSLALLQSAPPTQVSSLFLFHWETCRKHAFSQICIARQ